MNRNNTTISEYALNVDLKSDISTYQKIYNIYKNEKLHEKFKISIFSSYTIENFESILGVELIKNNCYPEFFIPGFNQYENEIYNEKGKFYKFNSDALIFLLRIEDLLPKVTNFNKDLPISEMVNPLIDKIENTIKTIKSNSSLEIFFSNFLYPKFIVRNISDHHSPLGQINLVNTINSKLNHLSKKIQGLYIFDFFKVASEFGTNNIFDEKLNYYASIPYNVDFLKYKANKLSQYINTLINGRKKCLVLDLDNTLWGGIIGEDKLGGIKLGNNYPGNVYLEIQKTIKEIGKTGVLLAINSKNNFKDAEEVFEKHPNSMLKLGDFASIQINWDEKQKNMIKIAEELNIGTDSFVFIDDNPVEIGAINFSCPEITTLQFEIDNPINNLKKIREMIFFTFLKITDEDVLKTKQYQQQAKRSRLRKVFNNAEDFFKSLDINITISECDKFSIPRISQLTMKTNQFNLTTKRYKESDIHKFYKDPNSHVYYLSVKDNIGDYGIVGVFIGFALDEKIIIDAFLMSCRVIGREIENAFLAQVISFLSKKGYQKIEGEYIQSKRNSLVKDFYKKLGFKMVENLWLLELPYEIKVPPWINIGE
tara:strand:+ start:5095 stop:6879 length:1785 start_codon:yes stop_codon:yes gene_type:complete